MKETKRRLRLSTRLRGAKAGPSYAQGGKLRSREGCREGTRSDGCVQESRKVVVKTQCDASVLRACGRTEASALCFQF
jgi:hypothetical protein